MRDNLTGRAALSEHPNIFMSPRKEPRYFDRDLKDVRIGRAEYFLWRAPRRGIVPSASATVWYLYSRTAVPDIQRGFQGPGHGHGPQSGGHGLLFMMT
jgi:hypothetical protein